MLGAVVNAGALHEQTFVFGPFAFQALAMQLRRDGEVVRLGARASTILLALVERAGNLLSKEELIARAWPGEAVGEGNLRVQVAALRKALVDTGDTAIYIANVAGRGYRFIAPVQYSSPHSASARALEQTDRRRSNLPSSLTSLIGRDEEVATLAGYLSVDRMVTVTGAGGVGKTTVAIASARRVATRFAGGVYFVDLAAVTSPEFVPFSIATAVNVAIEAERPVSSLVSRLRYTNALLILDNCEHLVGIVAMVVDELLRFCPGLSVLATSHEPLRGAAERVFRLEAFALPGKAEALTLDKAIANYPAVALFVEHAVSNDDAVTIGDADVPHILHICRQLDGLPLAIEIAAARVGALGTAELAARLDDRFGLLTGGRRTTAARHQTLRGMLDWSFDNLASTEQQVLRRLAVFAGDFSLEGGAAVASGAGLNWTAVAESLSNLVRKSLVNTTHSPAGVVYRLLDSTRLHALEKLQAAGELRPVRILHVCYLCDLLQRAEDEWIHMRQVEWLNVYGGWFDDIRAAIGWAFGGDGDAALGIELTTLTMPLGLQLGMVDELRDRVLMALDRVGDLDPPQKIHEMRLNLAYGYVCFNQNQPFVHYFRRAEALSDEIGIDRYRFEPLVQLAGTAMAKGRYVEALETGSRALIVAEGMRDDYALLAINRALAQINHFVGNHRTAIELADEVIRFPVANIPVTYGFVATDRRVSMRVILARALWVTGKADQAIAVVEEALSLAPGAGALAACQALALAAVPIRMWRGEWEIARSLTVVLRREAERYAVAQWIEWARVFESALESHALDKPLRFPAIDQLYGNTLVTLTGFEAVEVAKISEQSWCAPELLRVRGEALCRHGKHQAGLALVMRGLELAREQGASAWELRCATSLVRHTSGDSSDTRRLLAQALEQMEEGLDTADYRAAIEVLSAVGPPSVVTRVSKMSNEASTTDR